MKYRTLVADPPWPIGDFPEWGDGEGTIPTPYSTMSLSSIRSLQVSAIAEPDAHLYLWTINEYLPAAFGIVRAWGFVPSATLVWCKAPRGLGMGGAYVSNVEFILFCRRQGVPGHLTITSWLADAADRSHISRADVDAFMGTSDMAGWWLSRLEHRSRIPTPEQFQRLKELLGVGDEMDELYRALRDAERWKGVRSDTRWFTWPRGKHSQKPEHFYDLVEQVSPPPYVELFARRHRLGWDVWGNESANTATLGESA